MNNRRKLLVSLGVGTLTVPLSLFAQQKGKIWLIGFLWESEPSDYAYVQRIDASKAGMRELSYTEGKDYVIEHRSAKSDLARLPALAAELLALKADLIITQGTPSALAARNATREIPILIVTIGDPVGSGLVATLSRPAGNVTGLTGITSALGTKRLDLLHQVLPAMRRVGFLYNPDNAASAQSIREFEANCDKLQFKSLLVPIRKADEIVAAFNALKRDQAQGLLVTGGGTNLAWRATIIEQAAKLRLPAIYNQNSYAESGGLMSYGTNYPDLYRRAATYVDKIFKGAKPGDLPIEQPTKFELVLNMKAAKALGIKIPGSVLVLATQVIE